MTKFYDLIVVDDLFYAFNSFFRNNWIKENN